MQTEPPTGEDIHFLADFGAADFEAADFEASDFEASGGTARQMAPYGGWTLFTDRVMGGVSDGRIAIEEVAGRRALRMQGTVRLENNGGFVQMGLDLGERGAGSLYDASAYAGLALTVFGNGQTYGVHLRSADVTRPWQSWRQSFNAPPAWTDLILPFAAFTPHRIEGPLDLTRLRRLGIAAIGRAFAADLAVAAVALYRA